MSWLDRCMKHGCHMQKVGNSMMRTGFGMIKGFILLAMYLWLIATLFVLLFS